ncbi:hypothetical protein Enr13x_56170 [Stieleria neptunia]|uniref:SLA1 homology domain-containing protein n=1 Tax=Stieleria neptunia TaxID=2527979 RepID=A0A518HY02_9BACT|nr:hypothetical protein [Stieleria neptunia]QDV45738.1 hypothetical protein Enr13x_56170 [Stieleria neptunia]
MSPRFQCLLLLALVMIVGRASGQDEVPTQDQRQRWVDVYHQEAAAYEMIRQGDSPEVLQLVPSPILTFTNPVRVRDTHGAAFVWTSDGRPEVVGAIWSVISPDDSTKRRLSHEFHSLSLAPIRSDHEPRQSRRGPVPDWISSQPGVDPKKVPDAPPPARTANLRLTQMRHLARGFEATIPPGLGDGQGSLRLLAQPIYRYHSDRHGIIDGAVFAFVMGTDPELILLIEAAESAGTHQWRFAAAQLSNLPLLLDYKGSRVWECERAVPYVGDRPHFMYWGVSARDRVIDK